MKLIRFVEYINNSLNENNSFIEYIKNSLNENVFFIKYINNSLNRNSSFVESIQYFLLNLQHLINHTQDDKNAEEKDMDYSG